MFLLNLCLYDNAGASSVFIAWNMLAREILAYSAYFYYINAACYFFFCFMAFDLWVVGLRFNEGFWMT